MNKVVHVMVFYDVPGRAISSGAENHLYILMEGQVKAGWQVELLMVVGLDGARLDGLANDLRARGIEVTKVLFPMQGLSKVAKYARPAVLPRLMAALAARRDCIIHSHILTPGSHLFVLAGWLAGCKNMVSSYHNNEPELAGWPLRWRLILMDKVTRRTIAISRAVRDHLVVNVGLRAATTRLVYYGLPLPGPERSRAELRESLGVAADRFLVGFMGRLTVQKDIPTLLRALARVPEVQAVIVGGGELEAPLKAEAARLGLTNLVFAGPRVNGPELIGCFDVMVLCSSFEGLGLVLLEAMVRRVPIIGTKAGAIPEILADGAQGQLIEVGDDAALATEIRGLMGPAGEALAAQALVYAKEKFTVPAMVGATLAIYNEARDGVVPRLEAVKEAA